MNLIQTQESAICCIFQDDAFSLARGLRTYHDKVKYLLFFDGRYEGYNCPNELSIDGSRELLAKYKNAYVYDCPNLTQIQKRNKYFEIAERAGITWFIIIDSDEYITGDWQKFYYNLAKTVNVDLYGHIYGIPFADGVNNWGKPRLIFMPAGIRYKRRHYEFWKIGSSPSHFIKAKDQGPLNMIKTIDGIMIHHDYSLRSPERKSLSKEQLAWTNKNDL